MSDSSDDDTSPPPPPRDDAPPLSPHALFELRHQATLNSPFGSAHSAPVSALKRLAREKGEEYVGRKASVLLRHAPLGEADEDNLIQRLYDAPMRRSNERESATPIDAERSLSAEQQEVVERRAEKLAEYKANRERKAVEAALERSRLRLQYLESMSHERRETRAKMSAEAIAQEAERKKVAAARAAAPFSVGTGSGAASKNWSSSTWCVAAGALRARITRRPPSPTRRRCPSPLASAHRPRDRAPAAIACGHPFAGRTKSMWRSTGRALRSCTRGARASWAGCATSARCTLPPSQEGSG